MYLNFMCGIQAYQTALRIITTDRPWCPLRLACKVEWNEEMEEGHFDQICGGQSKVLG